MNVMEKLMEGEAFRKALQCIAAQNDGRILIYKETRDMVRADQESVLVGAPVDPSHIETSDYEFVIVASKEAADEWVAAKAAVAGVEEVA